MMGRKRIATVVGCRTVKSGFMVLLKEDGVSKMYERFSLASHDPGDRVYVNASTFPDLFGTLFDGLQR